MSTPGACGVGIARQQTIGSVQASDELPSAQNAPGSRQVKQQTRVTAPRLPYPAVGASSSMNCGLDRVLVTCC